MVKLFSLVVGVVGCVAVGWFVHDLTGGFGGAKAGGKAKSAPTVTVFTVTNAVFNPAEEFIGHVEPVQEVDILPQIEGYVTEVKFTEGAEVKKGDVLYEIDPEQYRATERQRLAELEKAESQVAVAEADVDRTARYLKRMQSADERGITKSELDQAETDHASTLAALKSAKADVAQAKANLELSRVNLKHTRVYAPISGQIGKSLRHAGDYVAPSKGALARIVQVDPIRVSFPITDRAYVTWRERAARKGVDVRASRRLRLKLPNDSLYGRPGTWEFDDNEMSAGTATIQLRLTFPNAEKLLIPNAYVRVISDEADPAGVLAVPSACIEQSETGPVVWVVRADGTAERRSVAKGASADGVTVIADGLKAGERIVHRGVHKVSAGAKLKVVAE